MSRQPLDAYNTPAWCVARLLEAVKLPLDRWWVEPAAGDGAIIKAARQARHKPRWVALEPRPECHQALRDLHTEGNPVLVDARTLGFLRWAPEGLNPGVIITNPPYRLADEFVRHALEVAPNAHVVLLMQLSILGSGARAPFLSRHAPDVYVLPNRPCFVVSLKCRSSMCDWAATVSPQAARPHKCPQCGLPGISVTQSAFSEYAWFHWPAMEHNRKQGVVRWLKTTPKEDRT